MHSLAWRMTHYHDPDPKEWVKNSLAELVVALLQIAVIVAILL